MKIPDPMENTQGEVCDCGYAVCEACAYERGATEANAKLSVAKTRIKELRIELAAAVGALHSHHDQNIDSPNNCPMTTCKQFSDVLRKSD